MSDQADLNKAIEDALASTFQHHDDVAHEHNNEDADDHLEEIDYDKHLVELLGEVDQSSKDTHDPNHQDDKAIEEEDFQIDFANVVQGIMDQYGDEENNAHNNKEEVPSTLNEPEVYKEHNEEVTNAQNGEETSEISTDKQIDDGEGHNFQDILAQLANEAVEKVNDNPHETSAESKEQHENVIPEVPNPSQQETSDNKSDSNKDGVQESGKDLTHEQELNDAIAQALAANNLNLETEIKSTAVPIEKPKKAVSTPPTSSQTPAAKIPASISKVATKRKEVPQQQQQHTEKAQAPINYFGELEQLAGESEHTNDLQAALAQMVKNVVEGNESDLDSDSDDSLSDSDASGDEGLAINQSQMNEILHNAFQLAMDQQSIETERDPNLNQHKAVLDDAISSLFGGDRSKAKQLPKAKKEIAAALTKKKVEKAPKAPKAVKAPKETAAKSKKPPTAKKAAKDVEASADVKPSVALSTPESAQATVALESTEQPTAKTDLPKAAPVPAKAAATPLKLTEGDQAASKKKTKLSIAETLALTRSSMKAAPRRDYSNIDSIERALKVAEKAESTSAKAPGVTTFQSTAAKKSTLAEAIQEMSNALQSSASASKTSGKSTEQQNSVEATTTKAASPPVAKNGNEQSLLDALLLAKQFMSQQSVKESAAETLSAINGAIDSLRKPEVATTDEKAAQNNLSASVMTNALTQALSNFAGTITTSRSKAGQTKKHKVKYDAPEIKERIRQGNRERKKKWRESNAERNRDNDLRFRVVKRATQLFGETDTEEKMNWVQAELDKRRKKRMERSVHHLKSYDSHNANNSDSSDSAATKQGNPVKAETPTINPGLIKSIMDAFGQRNVTPAAASAVAASAMQALKSSNGGQAQLTTAIANAISSIVNNQADPKSGVENITGVPTGAVSSFQIQTARDFSKTPDPELLKKNTLARAAEANAEKEISPPSKYPDPELTNMVRNSVATTTTKSAKSNENLSTALLAAAKATKEVMDQQKSGIASSLKNLSLTNARAFENFTTKKAPASDKRKSEETLTSDDSKRPRSVSPSPKVVESIKEQGAIKADTMESPSQAKVQAAVDMSFKKHQSTTGVALGPAVSQQSPQQQQQQQQQSPPPVSVTEPFKMAWSARTAFRLPQYRKPVSDYERSGSTPPSREATPPTGSPAEAGTPKRPLQRPGFSPGFSKPSAFQRPRW